MLKLLVATAVTLHLAFYFGKPLFMPKQNSSNDKDQREISILILKHRRFKHVHVQSLGGKTARKPFASDYSCFRVHGYLLHSL
ncbi:hypothetical protein Trydic_g10675 [Trypoxylus dichotomus]